MTFADNWQPASGLALEPNALATIHEIVRCVALTAGPGAGKTEVLAQRADFLLRTSTCPFPRRILAISFKVDAARNLKDRVRLRCGPDLAMRLDSHTFHAFAKRLIDRFRPVLTGANALDADYTVGIQRIERRQITFDEMVPFALSILRNSKVARNAVRQTYSHILLDEFQDCTKLQYQLIREAFLGTGSTLTAVGDTKQRIMGWAGALEGIFTVFASDFDAIPLNLYQNFRSQPRLRRMQNAMVMAMDPKAAVPEDELVGAGGSVEVLKFDDSKKEAESLAELIAHWINVDGIRPPDIAVLLSKQPELYTRPLMSELLKLGIPFRNEQALQDLAVEPVARLIVDLLRVVSLERQHESYLRLMSLVATTSLHEQQEFDMRGRWLKFIDTARYKSNQISSASSSATYMRILLEEFIAIVGRETLVSMSSDYERSTRLEEVVALTLDHVVELLRTSADVATALNRFSDDHAVRIMTVHKSKGLEFDRVVLLGVEVETYWGDSAEQRSVFFVGISRARSCLRLTVSAARARPDGYAKRWDEKRKPHSEFLSYATSTA